MAKVSGIIIPIMALGYIILVTIIMGMNIIHLPEVLKLIITNAFGWEQALGGGFGIAVMQGIKRGLFSNEAGMGSAPNVAATADVTHPVKQGLRSIHRYYYNMYVYGIHYLVQWSIFNRRNQRSTTYPNGFE